MANAQVRFRDLELDRLLEIHPRLTIMPYDGDELRVRGEIAFNVVAKGKEIKDSYSIEVLVPDGWPSELPRVKEIGGRIPQTFHHYPNGVLCLGSPIRLSMLTRAKPSLVHFVERCVVPYLFAHSYYDRFDEMPFGELQHGSKGIIDDLKELLGIADERECIQVIRLASLERRTANRQKCRCGSGKRVGRCHNREVNRVRRLIGRLPCRHLCENLHERKLRGKQQAILRPLPR